MPKRPRTRPYSSRKRRRTFKKRPTAYRARKRNFTKAVKKLIQSTAEVKRTGQNPQDYTFAATNAAMSTPVDIPSQFCFLATGANDGDRIGEQVRTKRAILKVYISASTTAPNTSILQLFIGKALATPGSAPTAAQLTGIFDDGVAGAPADGTKLSLMRAINKDAFSISHYKKIKIGYANATGYANNDFPAYRMLSIDITKHLGVLKYTGSAGSAPNNKHMYLFMNWVNPQTATGGSTYPPEVKYYVDFTYTDV